jgi:hypothetical protein
MIVGNPVQTTITLRLHSRDEGGRVLAPAFDLQETIIAAKQAFHSPKGGEFVAFNVDFEGDAMPGDW